MLLFQIRLVLLLAGLCLLDDPPSMPSGEFSPSLNDLPLILQLSDTFSKTSWGLNENISFATWSQNHQIDASTANQRRCITEWQAAIQADIDRFKQFEAIPTDTFFLTDNVRFSVTDPGTFQASLHSCALQHGHLISDPGLLQYAIDSKKIPPKFYVSQKQIYRNGDIAQFQTKVQASAQLCAILQPNSLTGLPQITAGDGCTDTLPSLCLFDAGGHTYHSVSMHSSVKRLFLVSAQHLFYLLSQLLNYPSPHVKFASDISLHLARGFKYYSRHIETKESFYEMTYDVLFDIEYCVWLVQLALQKAQHSEHWHSEKRQQQNFEKIQEYAVEQSKIMETFKTLSQQRQPEVVSTVQGHGDVDRGDDEGSGVSHGEGHDGQQSNNDSHGEGHDGQQSNNDGDSEGHDGQQSDNGSDQQSYNITEPSIFSWDYWLGPSDTNLAPQGNFSSNIVSEGNNNDIINGSYPFDIYYNLGIVDFWPFKILLSLAAFHLMSIIQFYISLIFNLLILGLACYVYVLSNRISRLEWEVARVKSKSQTVGLCTFKDLDQVKQMSNRQAQRQRFQQPDTRPDPDCILRLIREENV